MRRPIAQGHPWIYADALEPPPPSDGGVVDVTDSAGRFLARGIHDPSSPIAVRVLTLDPDEPVGPRMIADRIDRALALRRRVLPESYDALRLLHGEADLLPGIVCDRYANVLVLRFDADAVRRALGDLVLAALLEHFPKASFVEKRPDLRVGQKKAERLSGPPVTREIEVHEGVVRMLVDVDRGQKTGLYLDQRDNHLRVSELCHDASVLSLFSYTGGFGLHAAARGARHVTSVDSAAPVLEVARRNFALNGIAPEQHSFIVDDAMRFARQAKKQGRRYDVVVADPPSFAPSERVVPRALKSYTTLLADAAALVEVGGLLIAASCSSHVSESALMGAAAKGAAEAGRILRFFELRGAGPDHPTVASFPEGRYLKVLFAWVDSRISGSVSPGLARQQGPGKVAGTSR